MAGMAVSLLLRIYFAVPLAAESAGDLFTRILPVSVFSQLMNLFGHNAKHDLLVGMLLLIALLTAAVSLLVWEVRRRIAIRADRLPPMLRALAGDATPWYLQAVPLAVLLAGANYAAVGPYLGSQIPAGTSPLLVLGIVLAEALPAVITAVIFAVLVQVFGKGAPTRSTPTQASRRRLVVQGIGIVGALAFGGIIWEVLQRGLLRPGPSLRPNTIPDQIPPPTPEYTDFVPVPQQTPEITSADTFYYVSKNLTSDPDVQVENWQLTISGRVQHPYALSYAELQRLPAVERFQTLACISNEVGGPYISTGKFRGARLADILNAAGLQPDSRELIFRSADGYSDSLHLAQALSPETLVVYALNDAPLARAHGFPARLLIPGLYGMKNGKWLTSLEVGIGGYQGYWEQRGWTHEAVIKTMSRIDTPLDGDRLTTRPTIIAGIAFAGDRGISRVDVTVDGGATWQTAQMRRPLNALTWTLWQYPWTPTPGDHVIGVRAIDGQGHVQTQKTDAPLPSGASGYHAILVTVT